MGDMVTHVLGEDEYVTKVNERKAIKEISQNIFYQSLKDSRSICEAKRYDKILVKN